jgi:signal peptide peptidase-like protein 2B
MLRICLFLFLGLGLVHAALKPDVEMEVTGPSVHLSLPGIAAPAVQSYLSKSLDEAPTLSLVEAIPADACGPLKNKPKGPWAAVIARGTCQFGIKLHNAQRAGAAAVIVTDSLESIYEPAVAHSVPVLKASEGGPCLLRCEMSESPVKKVDSAAVLAGLPGSECSTAEGCKSGVCGLTGKKDEEGYQACCLPERYIPMVTNASGSDKLTIPATFMGVGAGQQLRNVMKDAGGSAHVRMATNGPAFGWLVSALLIWVLGCSVEALATWSSAHMERANVAAASGEAVEKTPPAVAPEESLEMTVGTALCYLVVATVGLVGLYLLIQQDARYVVFFMIGVFSMAALSVVTSLGTYPLVRYFAPDLDQKPCTLPLLGTSSVAWVMGFVVSVALVVTWVVGRHNPYAWILQDTFGVFVCCQFMLALRMNSIKVSTVLLVSFMIYDIFMVFITPAIFKSSVMVTVAQAGTGSASISKTDPTQCIRMADERMPMLFMLPRLGAEGEYAMLGLGDVLLPGLLLSFMLRYDTLCNHIPTASGCFGPWRRFRQRYPYWFLGMGGYKFGLFLAFLANTVGFTIFDVKGQPALLYLVPCTLGPMALYALIRGELGYLWDGPECLQTLVPMQGGLYQPLLKEGDV